MKDPNKQTPWATRIYNAVRALRGDPWPQVLQLASPSMVVERHDIQTIGVAVTVPLSPAYKDLDDPDMKAAAHKELAKTIGVAMLEEGAIAIEATQTTYSHEYVDELGVRDPVVALPETTSFEVTVRAEDLDLVSLWRLTHDMRVALCWAKENTPKLLHLATYAKTRRKRRKNIGRIVRAFFQGGTEP